MSVLGVEIKVLELGICGVKHSLGGPETGAREGATRTEVTATRDSQGITAFAVGPQAGPADVIDAFAAFMSSGPTPLVLWDLRAASIGRFTGVQLQQMVEGLLTFSNAERQVGRSAFVTSREVDYGVVRMLTTQAELGGYPVKMRVYRDLSVARAWLLGHFGE